MLGYQKSWENQKKNFCENYFQLDYVDFIQKL